MPERKIEQSERSIVKLQAHTEKGTCPRDLRYVARANITPDEEFTLHKERGREEIHR